MPYTLETHTGVSPSPVLRPRVGEGKNPLNFPLARSLSSVIIRLKSQEKGLGTDRLSVEEEGHRQPSVSVREPHRANAYTEMFDGLFVDNRLVARVYGTFALQIGQKDRTAPRFAHSRVRECGTSGHAAAH